MRMTIDGACHCGRIRYEADIDPDNVIICHCPDCQTNSGAPYRANVPVLLANFRLTGEPKVYTKTGGSGAKVNLSFCGACGSAMFSTKAEGATVHNLRLGSVRQRAELVPKAQYFCRAAMPWVFDLAAIPRSEDSRPVKRA